MCSPTFYKSREKSVYYKVIANSEPDGQLSISKFDLDSSNIFYFEENQKLFSSVLKEELMKCAPEEAAMLQLAGVF